MQKGTDDLDGISKSRAQRVLCGQGDLRRGKRPKGPWGISVNAGGNQAYNDIVLFLLQLWSSTAEGLPNRLKFSSSAKPGTHSRNKLLT